MAQPDEKIVFHGVFSDGLVPTLVTGDCLAAFSAGFVDHARRFHRKYSRTTKKSFKKAAKSPDNIPAQELTIPGQELAKEPEKEPVNHSQSAKNPGNISAQELAKEPEKQSVDHSHSGNKPHVAALDSLLPELRLHLLSQLDFSSLKNLVRASPVYHAQYAVNRTQALFKSFMNTAGGAALDAQMAFHSCTRAFQDALSKETVTQFLLSYAKYHTSIRQSSFLAMSPDGTASDSPRPDDPSTLDGVLAMIKFHNSVVNPLVQHFADWALQNLSQLPGAQPYSQPLSQTEETRISRAIYRYQICCNLFGLHSRETNRPSFKAEYLLDQLEVLFEPWEIEEVTCITLFFERKCKALATAIERDLEADGANSEEGLLAPPT